MNTQEIQSSIDATRRGFEETFAAPEFYNRQTNDDKHITDIINFIRLQDGMQILDLGCGGAYLSFAIAKANKNIHLTGLDIISSGLDNNRLRAQEEELGNVDFISYDGINFPFPDETFDLVVSRYALHHFPDINHSIGEVSRVLKQGGHFFLADPTPNECDDDRFIDDYMRLKKDGHIKIYTLDEWQEICTSNNLELTERFDSQVRFPKLKSTAIGYKDVLARHNPEVIASYDLVETEDEIYTTTTVNNLLFTKQ